MNQDQKVPRKRKVRPPVDPLVAAARLRRMNDVPRHLRALFTAAWAGRSRKLAIKAQCVECMGFQRSQVKGCTSFACPLYPYRPSQTEAEVKVDAEAEQPK